MWSIKDVLHRHYWTGLSTYDKPVHESVLRILNKEMRKEFQFISGFGKGKYIIYTIFYTYLFINFILDGKLSQDAGHLNLTSWCTQFYLQWHICAIIVYICVYKAW